MTPENFLTLLASHVAGCPFNSGGVAFAGWLFRINETPSGRTISVAQIGARPGDRSPSVQIALDGPADWRDQLRRFVSEHRIPYVLQVL